MNSASPLILIVEDEPEVRDALMRDLQPFASKFVIEVAEDAPDARLVLREANQRCQKVALVLCDHLLPGQTGTEFLVDLRNNPQTVLTRKVLVTGQAGLQDTVRAVNEAGLDYYIAKPWTREKLHEVVRAQLTDFVIGHMEDLLPYVSILDSARLMEATRSRASDT